jgi:polysaccharide export outer membrane protein
MKQFVWFYLLIFGLFFNSCITNKDLVYLQDKGTTVNASAQVQTMASPYRVQVNDILSINIKSTDSELKSLLEIFRPTEQSNAQINSQSLYFNGFTVDVHGNIEFPILDKINVLGYTTDEIEKKVKQALLDKYLKDVSKIFVTVKLAGLRYTVTGEVGGGGVLTLFQDRVNIIEALANAGDIRDTGDRTDVLVVRQYPDGQKIHHIDLTDKVAMKSPYYYIKPNDMIIVKPLKRKALGAGQTVTQNITTFASIFSVLLTTYILIRGN